ncbi:PP-loop domain protein [Thermoproteus uzoniensis 768-20]|uniref:PP-loop domain protein n=1 Tax=Thermoproteus uzoniensis (strain 768-20) TaxID=999630 RepID=F2L3Q6_THEU7|nr:TIGR00269 family protein [Thermoproteus uzoniensis]AEA12040.1 PP-loop domain protein [Thermoproteus uzoniensis 768-20]
MTAVCTSCGKRQAQFLRRSSGERLCLNCLFRSIEEKVWRTIRDERMIEPGDKVAVAISGGKDSLVLLDILGKLKARGRLKDVELEAFTINEGHPYSCFYRMSRADFVKELAGRYGVAYSVFNFKEVFGYSALELAERLWKSGVDIHMCAVDGILRRKAMNLIGKRRGWTKIATAHNLDDEAQTVLLNVLMGNLKRFAWLDLDDAEEKDLVRRIKPLKYVREEEVAVYAHYHGIPLMELECPYVYTNPRYGLKFMLAELEERMPNVKYNLVSFGRRLGEVLRGQEIPYSRCKYCGAPSSRDVCRACELFEKAGLLDGYLRAISSYLKPDTPALVQ